MLNIGSDLSGRTQTALTQNVFILGRNSYEIREAGVSVVGVIDSVWICSRRIQRRRESFVGAAVRSQCSEQRAGLDRLFRAALVRTQRR